jgi:hypothetical protein
LKQLGEAFVHHCRPVALRPFDWIYIYIHPKVGNKMQNGPGYSKTGLRLVIVAHRLGASSTAALNNTACGLFMALILKAKKCY